MASKTLRAITLFGKKHHAFSTSLYMSLENMTIAVFSFLGGYYLTSSVDDSSPVIDGLWAVISGLLVLRKTSSQTFLSARMRMIGSIIGAVVSVIYLSIFPFSVFGLGFCIAIGVLVCHVINLPDKVRITGVSIAVIMLISSVNPDINPLLNGALRVIESFMGCFVALLVSLVPIPSYIRNG